MVGSVVVRGGAVVGRGFHRRAGCEHGEVAALRRIPRTASVAAKTDLETLQLSGADFDAILVAAGAPRVPEKLVAQLAVHGRLVVPVGDQHSQELIKIYRDENGIRQTNLGGCRFVKLVGEYGWGEK